MVDDQTERIAVDMYTMEFRPNYGDSISSSSQKVRFLKDGKIPNWDPKTQARWVKTGIHRKNECEHGVPINPSHLLESARAQEAAKRPNQKYRGSNPPRG